MSLKLLMDFDDKDQLAIKWLGIGLPSLNIVWT